MTNLLLICLFCVCRLSNLLKTIKRRLHARIGTDFRPRVVRDHTVPMEALIESFGKVEKIGMCDLPMERISLGSTQFPFDDICFRRRPA